MTIDQKKKLGAYYTPTTVTDYLSEWAIRSVDNIVLEPSFGGCNFLLSTIHALRNLGNDTPQRNIYGFDIDPKAFEILGTKNLVTNNFIEGDFLKTYKDPDFFVDVVIGNPPYVSIHKMDEEYKSYLFKTYNKSPFKIEKRSSLWVYFIVHSLKYLKIGGRMAWVVPDAITFTNYGKTLIKQLEEKFGSVNIFRVEERFFNESGTKEKTSFLLCEDYLNSTCKAAIINFKTLTKALAAVRNNIEGKVPSQRKKSKIRLGKESRFKVKHLGDFFDIRIGIVVGATKLLVFNEENIKKLPYYPNYVYPIITKGKQLEALHINVETLTSNYSRSPIYIIDAITMELEQPDLFEKLLLSIPTSTLLNQTFQNRSNLFGYDDYKLPDAFLTFYSQSLARIIINENKELNCTNSVHRLFYKADIIEDEKESLLKLFALQTFSEVLYDHVRAVAREYGNQIIKFEPSDAANIPLLIPNTFDEEIHREIDDVYAIVKLLVCDNRIEEAKLIARNFFLGYLNA